VRSSYTYLYTHFIWSTWKRQEIIDPDLEPILHQLISEKVNDHNSKLLKVGGTSDHVHLLINVNPVISVSKLIKEIKGYSSFTVANIIRPNSYFKWQAGYGAISVSPGSLSTIIKYITNQKVHHREDSIRSKWEL